jgi:cytochrome oxidase Cu insertion factor (SCO1/SenC/PrrC family)
MRRASFTAVLVALLVTVGMRPSLFAQTQPAPKLPPMTLKVGDSAPDFTLRDQSGKEVSLKDFQGKKTVVLAFYVFAFSGG